MNSTTRFLKAKVILTQKITAAIASADFSRKVLRLEVPIGDIKPLTCLDANNFKAKIFWQDRGGKTAIVALGEADSIWQRGRVNYSSLLKKMHTSLACHRSARYFGGICFDAGNLKEPWTNFGAGRFILPRFEITQSRGRTTLSCNLFLPRDKRHGPQIIDELKSVKIQTTTKSRQQVNSHVIRLDTPNKKTWDEILDRTLTSIYQSAYDKVVLARQSKFTLKNRPLISGLLTHLITQAPRCFIFSFQFDAQHVFLGATPERLYRREDGKIMTEAIAGTRSQGRNKTERQRLITELLNSAKEHREHHFVVDMLHQRLNRLCVHFSQNSQPQLLSFHGGYHLLTQFKGNLKPKITDAGLLKELHPTPAVAGSPTNLALKEIRKAEPFSRGWYAGPVGFIGRDTAEFAVAIRSGILNNRTMTVFAGAGIVAGSTADNEWQEIEQKIEIFREVIGV